jgi:DNA-binding NtrC family response regulator
VPKLIAVIDDEKEMEDIYTMLLQRPIQDKLLELRFFSDSRVFVHWLITHSPDLIMTDMNMPHINGIELIDLVSKTGRNVPTYIVSGDDPQEFQSLMQSCDFVHFLGKPFHFNHILSLIQHELGIAAANLER